MVEKVETYQCGVKKNNLLKIIGRGNRERRKILNFGRESRNLSMRGRKNKLKKLSVKEIEKDERY